MTLPPLPWPQQGFEGAWGRRLLPLDPLTPASAPAQVRPACLPMFGQKFLPGRSCFITGFGKTNENEGMGRGGGGAPGLGLCNPVRGEHS